MSMLIMQKKNHIDRNKFRSEKSQRKNEKSIQARYGSVRQETRDSRSVLDPSLDSWINSAEVHPESVGTAENISANLSATPQRKPKESLILPENTRASTESEISGVSFVGLSMIRTKDEHVVEKLSSEDEDEVMMKKDLSFLKDIGHKAIRRKGQKVKTYHQRTQFQDICKTAPKKLVSTPLNDTLWDDKAIQTNIENENDLSVDTIKASLDFNADEAMKNVEPKIYDAYKRTNEGYEEKSRKLRLSDEEFDAYIAERDAKENDENQNDPFFSMVEYFDHMNLYAACASIKATKVIKNKAYFPMPHDMMDIEYLLDPLEIPSFIGITPGSVQKKIIEVLANITFTSVDDGIKTFTLVPTTTKAGKLLYATVTHNSMNSCFGQGVSDRLSSE